MRIDILTTNKRPAIAMIELIFAIVVIGITLLSVPLMVNQASQSTYTTLQQEAIAAAASDMGLILSREWDDANTNDSLDSTILTTASTNYNLAARTNLRSRTYYTSIGGTRTASTTLGSDSSDSDDIDDVGTVTLTSLGGSDLIDKTMTIATTVSYLNDGSTSPIGTSAGGTSNIKGITITLTSGVGGPAELQKTVELNAFSCNIGSYKLERKVF